MALLNNGFMDMLNGAPSQFPAPPRPQSQGLLGLLQQFFQPQNSAGQPLQAVQAPGEADQPTGFRRLLDPQVALPMAAALMQQGKGNTANFSDAMVAGGMGLSRQREEQRKYGDKNKTLAFLRREDPQIAAMIDAGMPMAEGWKAFQDKQQARSPKWNVSNVGGNLVRYDERGAGSPEVIYRGEGARPMSADERSQWGIPASDQRAYYLKDGTPHAVGGGGVNVQVGGERGFDKTVGEGYGKRFLDIQDGAQSAQRSLNALSVMEQSMADPGFYSGSGAGAVANLKRMGAALGLPGAEGIDSIETFAALSKQAALDSMGGSLGTGFSNADRDFVTGQVPGLDNSPQGNAALIGIQRKLAQRKQQIAQLARQYANQHEGRIDAGFDDYLAQWAEANPLFPSRPQGSGANRGAGGASGRQRARNPQTGETLEWDGSQWRPVP